MRHRRHCLRFLCKETFVTIATIANNVGSQQWQWCGQATMVETEAAAGAHNNQPRTNSSNTAAEKVFSAAAATTAAAMAAAVATAAMAATAAAQTAAGKIKNCESDGTLSSDGFR